jgi:proteasome assembly chaperone (PAC2) family protein
MKARLLKEPELVNPILLCGWSGIGNIGLIAVDTLRMRLGAEEFAEIDSFDYFYPRKVKIENGLLVDLEFPGNRFYFKKHEKGDIIFFIGEEQPGRESKSYSLGNAVLDVAAKFGCRRIYTSGAAVTYIHHETKPRVWVVPNSEDLIDEVKKYKNTYLMSRIERGRGQGYISGLNGLLIGMARERGLEGICLMGEFPNYVSHSIPYPKASVSVLEVLTRILGIEIELKRLQKWAQETESKIEEYYQQMPDELKEQIEKIKNTETEHLTEEDGKSFVKEVEDFLKRREEGGER